jgi:hypothetical protein
MKRFEITVKDTRKKAVAKIASPMAGPGQLLTHYSPAVPAYLIDLATSFVVVSPSENNKDKNSLVMRYQPPSSSTGSENNNINALNNNTTNDSHMVVGGVDARTFPLSQTILIDYGDILLNKLIQTFPGFDPKTDLRAYKSLSPKCKSDEASREVFAALRWTENIEGAQAVALPLVMGMLSAISTSAGASESHTATTTTITKVKKSHAALEKALLEAVEDRLFRAASGRTAVFARQQQD